MADFIDPKTMEALDLHVAFMDSLRTTLGQTIFNSYAKTFPYEMWQNSYSWNVQQALAHGETYTVSPDICDVLEITQEDLPFPGMLSIDMLPSDAGFVRFERPIDAIEKDVIYKVDR